MEYYDSRDVKGAHIQLVQLAVFHRQRSSGATLLFLQPQGLGLYALRQLLQSCVLHLNLIHNLCCCLGRRSPDTRIFPSTCKGDTGVTSSSTLRAGLYFSTAF